MAATAARIRADRRRAGLSLGAGVFAAATTLVLVISVDGGDQPTADPSVDDRSDRTDTEGESGDTGSSPPSAMPADGRLVPIPSSAVMVPVTAGSQVEIVGLSPTVDSVRPDVIVSDATVVDVSDGSVVVLVDRSDALRILELQAVGQIAILGKPDS